MAKDERERAAEERGRKHAQILSEMERISAQVAQIQGRMGNLRTQAELDVATTQIAKLQERLLDKAEEIKALFR